MNHAAEIEGAGALPRARRGGEDQAQGTLARACAGNAERVEDQAPARAAAPKGEVIAMAEETKPSAKPASSSTSKTQGKQRADDAPDLEPSDAEAPGPISPEHESGSWEQTLAEQEARDKLQEARQGKSSKS